MFHKTVNITYWQGIIHRKVYLDSRIILFSFNYKIGEDKKSEAEKEYTLTIAY